MDPRDRSSHVADPTIANLDSSARVLLTTVAHKLLPALSNANAAMELGQDAHIQWSDTLNHYVTTARQIDQLWQDIQPASDGLTEGSGFDLTIVTPISSGHPTAEQLQQLQQHQLQAQKGGKNGPPPKEPIFTGVNVPPLLSTMIPTDDSHRLPTADGSYTLPTTEAEEALLLQIQAHNEGVSNVVEAFSARIEQWRVDKDSSQAGGSGGSGVRGGSSKVAAFGSILS